VQIFILLLLNFAYNGIVENAEICSFEVNMSLKQTVGNIAQHIPQLMNVYIS